MLYVIQFLKNYLISDVKLVNSFTIAQKTKRNTINIYVLELEIQVAISFVRERLDCSFKIHYKYVVDFINKQVSADFSTTSVLEIHCGFRL